jgi:hypothetical protein
MFKDTQIIYIQNNFWRARGSVNHHFRNPDNSFGIEKIRLLTERPFVLNSSILKPNFLYIRAMYIQ